MNNSKCASISRGILRKMSNDVELRSLRGLFEKARLQRSPTTSRELLVGLTRKLSGGGTSGGKEKGKLRLIYSSQAPDELSGGNRTTLGSSIPLV